MNICLREIYVFPLSRKFNPSEILSKSLFSVVSLLNLFEIIYFFSIKNISTYLATVKINSQKIIIISIYREPVLGLALHQSHPLTFYMYIYVENVKWGLNKPKFPHLVFYLVSSKDLWHLQLKVLSFILFRAIFSTEITN